MLERFDPMGFSAKSRVFDAIRGEQGLSDAQLETVVAWIDRSPMWTLLVRDFEENDGVITYGGDTNYFRAEVEGGDLVPTVYVADKYAGVEADLDEFAEVSAHEMAHYLSYYYTKFNPNELTSSDACAIAGSWDEARAYALEYFVQEEINATAGTPVDWMKEGQLEALQRRLGAAEAIKRSENLSLPAIGRILDAAADGLWYWAASWTGADPAALCYLQSYRKSWFDGARQWAKDHPDYVIPEAECSIDRASLRVDYAPDGTLTSIEYRDDKGAVRKFNWADVRGQWMALYDNAREHADDSATAVAVDSGAASERPG